MTTQPEESTSTSVDKYLAKVEEMSQQQHEKVAQLISGTQQKLDAFQPIEPTGEGPLDEQMGNLYQSVNEQLEKAMNAINEQIEAISKQTSP